MLISRGQLIKGAKRTEFKLINKLLKYKYVTKKYCLMAYCNRVSIIAQNIYIYIYIYIIVKPPR